MRLAASSSSYRRRLEAKELDVPSLFMELATLGIGRIEIASAHLANLTPAYLDQLRTQSTSTRITIDSIEIRPDFGYPNPEERARQGRDLAGWIQVARSLEIPTLHVHTGAQRVNDDNQILRDWTKETLERVLTTAESAGLIIALQDDAHIFADQTEPLNCFRSPALALSLDLRSLARVPAETPIALLQAPFDDDPERNEELVELLLAQEKSPRSGLVVLAYRGSRDPGEALKDIIKRIA